LMKMRENAQNQPGYPGRSTVSEYQRQMEDIS